MIALAVAFVGLFAAENPAVEILRRTAAAYENLQSFELSASISAAVPGHDVTITTGQKLVHATAAMLPADAPVPRLSIGIVGGRPVYRNSAGEKVAADVGRLSIRFFPFAVLDVIDRRVISARMLPDETLFAAGESLPCTVVEVLYEEGTSFDAGVGRPVRFWIDQEASLVRQVVYEREWRDGGLARWTARVEKMTVDQPPPAWAVDRAASTKGREETKWIGQAAPEFSLTSLDGRTVTLSALRGQVVVLNFWATWCSPCRMEMPLLEELRDELKSQGVDIWGVTDEAPDVARRWLADKNRSLPTLIDANRELFEHYEIEEIPVVLVLRDDGTVSSHVVGLRGVVDLRADITAAMD